jgi:hypothetical protein
MNRVLLTLIGGLLICADALSQIPSPIWGTEILGYHKIISTPADSSILPWCSTDQGKSFDFVINATWKFWNTMRTDRNGLPYYMNHQVWREGYNDPRGIGGDQFAMALSSWNILYGYSGNEDVKDNMKYIADYYITHSLSPANAAWPNIPYPYNTLIYSGIYDGDMILGKDFTQPDKAGSFGLELMKLYKMTSTSTYPNITDKLYLDAAVKIANTLAGHIKTGDEKNAPMPFKVNALTGETGKLRNTSANGKVDQLSSYCTNWSGTMELFLGLIDLKTGEVENYRKAFGILLNWMKAYPLKNNVWGPFFEDVPGWSDTQINAVTFAQFMMNRQEYFPDWKNEVKGIFNWVYKELGNKEWGKYGVTVVNEQTAYRTPGNSHTSRQASAELQYAFLTDDQTFVKNAIRQLTWATYMVAFDGRNCYPHDQVWMTDGYGDYIRHFLRSMKYFPELVPFDQDHLINSESVIQLMEYSPAVNKFQDYEIPSDMIRNTLVHYRTFDNESVETFKMTAKPSSILVNKREIHETEDINKEGWSWKTLENGGLLTIRHKNGNSVVVLGD